MIEFNRAPSFERILTAITRKFTHSLYVAFILAGVASAIVSSVAEFEIIRAFYPQHGILDVTTFAVLVVLVLEVVKVFLVFFNRAYSNANSESYAAVRPIFNSIRYTLVIISLISMQLFTLYGLNNPEYESQLARAQASLRASHNEHVGQINASFTSRKKDQFALDDADVQLWRAKMEFEMNNVVGRTWEGKYFGSHKGRFEEAKKLQGDNQRQLEIERLNAVSRQDSAFRTELETVKGRLKTDPASQNRVLSAALQVINGGPEYGYWQYALAVMIVSVLLSVTLESTIWVVFTALAITYGDTFTSSLQLGSEVDKYAAAGRTIVDMDSADTNAFRERVTREKRTILDTVRAMINRR